MPANLAISKALPTDLPLVYSGELDYIRTIEPAQETGWKNAMRSHLVQWTSCLDRMFVLERDGDALGYYFWQMDGEKAVLASIYVKPEQRRSGLGNQLLKHFMLDAFHRGHPQLALGVHVDNPVRALYEAAGFKRVRDDTDYLHYEMIFQPEAS